MLNMNAALGTPADFKVAKAMPEAGAHVLGSSMTSKDMEGVYNEIERFAVDKLKLTKMAIRLPIRAC